MATSLDVNGISLESLAKRGEPLPKGLNSAQQRLYLSLRSLYNQYRAGHIDTETGVREKAQIVQAYEIDMLHIRANADAIEIRKQVGYLVNDKSECPDCRRIGRILDGREKV